MADFQQFDLARAYSAAEGVKAMQQDSQLRGVQLEGAKLALEKAKQPAKMTYDEMFDNTRMMHAAAVAVAADPSKAGYWTDQLNRAGLQIELPNVPPQQLQQMAAQMAEETGSVLGALDPKQYGEKEMELPDWAKDAVVQGVDPRDPQAMQQYHQQWMVDKEAAANQRALLSAETSRRGQDITARGQDISAENARLAREAAATKVAAPGNPTGEERKNAVLATRLQKSLATLDEIEKKNPGASQPSYGERALEAVGQETLANVFTRGPDRQRADAAQADALDAALTLATGAAYTEVQFEAAKKSHFPQIGDSPEVVAEKRQRLATLVAAARAAAGRSGGSVDPAIAAGAPASPAAAPAPAPFDADKEARYQQWKRSQTGG